MVDGTNGVEMTRQQHEAAQFLSVLEGTKTFIGRLEVFLNEMDRRTAALGEAPAGEKAQAGAKDSRVQPERRQREVLSHA